MNGLKRVLLAVAIVGVLALAFVGLAVPNIVLHVQPLGVGSNPLVSPVCSGGFYPASNGVQIELGSSLPAGSKVYVILYNSSGVRIASNYTEFPNGWPANTPFLVHFNSTVMNSADFARTRVIVYDGYSQNLSTGTISLAVQKMSVGNWSGEYAQPINITYNGSRTLHNWPVKIVLSNNNSENTYGPGYSYIEWPVLQSNVKSIHFVDSEGHLLYYWIEIFHPGTYPNYDDAYAVIWVNVTDIPPNGTKIWMIYGSGDYSQYNNGKKVFWFFDGFESPSLADDGWSLYSSTNNGSRLSDFGFGYESYRSFNRFNYFDRQDGALKKLPAVLQRSSHNITLEYWDYRKNLTKGALDRVGILDDGGNGFGAVMRALLDGSTLYFIKVDTRVNYAGTTHSGTGTKPPAINNNTWYLMRLNIFTNGSLEVQIFNETGYLWGKPMGDIWYNNDTDVNFSQVYIKGGSAYYVDDLRVRFTQRERVVAKVDEWYANLEFRPGCYVPSSSGGNSSSEYVIPVTIHNSTTPQSSRLLPAYVVNFTYRLNPADYSNVYVTDSNGDPLYYWYYYQPQTGITWFWVNVTAYNTSKTETIYVHLNGTSYDPAYFNPSKVFWHFSGSQFNVSAGSGTVISYDPANFINSGYEGFVFDTLAKLGNPGTSNYLGPYLVPIEEPVLSLIYYYYGIGLEGDANLYEVRGNSPSGVTVYQPLNGGILSWNESLYSLDFLESSQSGGNVDVKVYQNNKLTGYGTISPIFSSLRFITPYLGQKDGGTSTYYWIGLRPYSYYAPSVTVGTLQSTTASTLALTTTSSNVTVAVQNVLSGPQQVPKK